jgi:anti-sigma factor RsiW
MSRKPEELLSAYVDGVGELAPEERRAVEQMLRDDPSARADEAATRELLDGLRDLPPIGNEPSWTQLEQAIGREVGGEVPRVAQGMRPWAAFLRGPWWRRNLKWIESGLAIATVAAIAMLWLSRGEPVEPLQGPTVEKHPREQPTSDKVALWINDDAVEVGEADAQRLIDDFDDEIQALATEDDGSDNSLVPTTTLEWVDGLDDKSLENAERWLERAKSG